MFRSSTVELVGVPTAHREPRQNRKGATVAKSGCGTPFFLSAAREPDGADPMHDDDGDDISGTVRVLRGVLFVLSAIAFAGVVKLLLGWSLVGGPLVLAALGGGFLLWRWRRRTRLVRMLRRGEVNDLISSWTDRVEALPHSDTLAPLLTATAFAAYGRVEDAQRALRGAARGPAWEAALEHRLFLEVLLSTFEGETDAALASSARLSALPLPKPAHLRTRVENLREAVAALARAFVHRARPGDLERLERASEASPLVHWAMLYAAAIVAIDEGKLDHARALIAPAPRWPSESAFRSFHDQIEAHLAGGADAR